MSLLAKTTSTNLSSFTRNCLASTSRLSQFRYYATEPPLPTATASPDEPVFGITIEKKVDKAVIKRYRGVGFPFIPVSVDSISYFASRTSFLNHIN